jgi:hypothetical protein
VVAVDVERARKIFFALMAAIILAATICAPFSKVTIDLASFRVIFGLSGVLILVSFYCRFRKMPFVAAALETVGFGFLITVPVLLLTYFAVAAGFPLADARLDAMDRALGFDWLGFIRFIDARPALSSLLIDAYQSISFQLLILPIALIAFGKLQRAYALIGGYALLCVAASAIATFYPALGTYAYYGVTQGSLSNINPHFALYMIPDFEAVYYGSSHTLTLGRASGLICFPSVHAGVACLCTWAAWELKWLRYPVLLLNVAMTVAAVSHANHYLIDIIAGQGTAALCIVVVSALFYRHQRPWWPAIVSQRSHVAPSA